MKPIPSARVQSLGGYAFAEVDKKVEELRGQGIDPIDFGVGDPAIPTPERIRRAAQRALDEHASSGYPSYIGSPAYREAVAGWTKSRFGVSLDPATEICSTIGSKEGIFHFAECYLDPGSLILAPSPGYPPYQRGTLFSEGATHFVPLLAENAFLPNLSRIPEAAIQKAKILWINYPNSPTGALAPDGFFEEAVSFAREHGLILASDEAYSEIYYDSPPRSALEFGLENVIVFQSLSKRSAMTGYRVGWVAGDPEIVATFKKVKTNIDSGTPNFIQAAAIEALSDESHVEEMREEYRVKRNTIVKALIDLGLPDCTPAATFYLWQRVPDGMTDTDFALALLDPEIGIVTTPGTWISDEIDEDGFNPGAGYVRFALVPTIEQCNEAAERLGRLKL